MLAVCIQSIITIEVRNKLVLCSVAQASRERFQHSETRDCCVQAMDAGGEGDAGHSRGLDIASLVHRYGRSFVHSNPDVALEYYMRVSSVLSYELVCTETEVPNACTVVKALWLPVLYQEAL